MRQKWGPHTAPCLCAKTQYTPNLIKVAVVEPIFKRNVTTSLRLQKLLCKLGTIKSTHGPAHGLLFTVKEEHTSQDKRGLGVYLIQIWR